MNSFSFQLQIFDQVANGHRNESTSHVPLFSMILPTIYHVQRDIGEAKIFV